MLEVCEETLFTVAISHGDVITDLAPMVTDATSPCQNNVTTPNWLDARTSTNQK